jgi:hypothetical protein
MRVMFSDSSRSAISLKPDIGKRSSASSACAGGDSFVLKSALSWGEYFERRADSLYSVFLS